MSSLAQSLSASAHVELHSHSLSGDSLDKMALALAGNILDTIYRYRLKTSDDPPSASTIKFLVLIYERIKASKPIHMCLPAFPFKSPNSESKVLGCLPDKAEEIALAHLNGLCAAIGDIYHAGAKLVIVSDGLVYNDLLCVPDKHVWAYGESLRAMAAEKKFECLEFSRLNDLVSLSLPEKLEEITYVANATNFRCALLNKYGSHGFDAARAISTNVDTCLTYRGYIKFLEHDLKTVYSMGNGLSKSKLKRGIGYIAKQMLQRGDAFARAVSENFADHLRLSIHPSTGKNKISIGLLPTDTTFTTPWHCTIAFGIDGSIMTGPRSDYDDNPAYELVHENNRPSYYREKSDLLRWKSAVICEPLYPCGLLIRPAAGLSKVSMENIEACKVRALAEFNSPVILRGFSNSTDRDLFIKKAEELGQPMPWKFGIVLEVKDQGTDSRGLNNVLSGEWMPFHFDGLFKTQSQVQTDGSEKMVPVPPRFQFFTAVTPSPKGTGSTLFSASRLLLKNLPAHISESRLPKLTWSVSTTSFNATRMQGLPLVQRHPSTGAFCLRYHEPWPQSKTAFEATEISIDGMSGDESRSFCHVLDALLHDRRVCYWHEWEKGDLLVSDNISMMHTRSSFTGEADRELWRIHFD